MHKFDNIKSDLSLQQSDVMILAETWVKEKEDTDKKFELNKFEAHLNKGGRGKGLAVFYKQEFMQPEDLNEVNMNITKIESQDVDIIAIYRSQEGKLSSLVNKLESLIDFSKTTLIIGDMNICNRKKNKNLLKTYLEGKTFNLIVTKSTHIDGGHIDHAYLMNKGNFEDIPDVEIVSKY